MICNRGSGISISFHSTMRTSCSYAELAAIRDCRRGTLGSRACRSRTRMMAETISAIPNEAENGDHREAWRLEQLTNGVAERGRHEDSVQGMVLTSMVRVAYNE